MTYDEFKAKYASGMPKGRKSITHPEDDLQKQCVRWFKEVAYPQLAPLLFHPNNEPYFGAGKTADQKARAGARAKAMGVTAGVADIILLHPGMDGSHGLCVELKSRTGRQSKQTQLPWQKAVEAIGYRYEICRTLEHFQSIIIQHLGIEPEDSYQHELRRIFGPKIKAKTHKSNKE